MASLTSQAMSFESHSTTVDTTLQYALGTRAFDTDGNEYIYMQGVASNTAQAAVTYDEDYVTTLSGANAVGPVAISEAIIDSTSEYGWYMVRGEATGIAAENTTLDNAPCYLHATAGAIGKTDVAGDAIVGMWTRSTADATDDLTLQLDYPKVHNIAFD